MKMYGQFICENLSRGAQRGHYVRLCAGSVKHKKLLNIVRLCAGSVKHKKMLNIYLTWAKLYDVAQPLRFAFKVKEN